MEKRPYEVMGELIKSVDVCIANEEDCQMALDIETDADVHSGKLEHDQYRRLTDKVLESYANLKLIAVTLRESKSASHNGWSACLNNRKEFLLSRHYEITHIVDRVGGGDSLRRGIDLRADHHGQRQGCARVCCRRLVPEDSIPGDFNRFTSDEVRGLIKGGGSGRVQR